MIRTKDGEDQVAGREQHVAALRERPTGELEETYRQLDALEAAVRAEKLEVLAVLDER